MHVRSFIAVEMPSEVGEEVVRIQKILSGHPHEGKMIEQHNLHLTLKFLGERSLPELATIREALETVSFPALTGTLKHIGTFDFKKNPHIVWVKIEGIEGLQKHIDDTLAHLLPQEKRFMSHLTIARIKSVPNPQVYEEHLKTISPKNITFPVTSFHLKSSELTHKGPIYTTLQEFRSRE